MPMKTNAEDLGHFYLYIMDGRELASAWKALADTNFVKGRADQVVFVDGSGMRLEAGIYRIGRENGPLSLTRIGVEESRGLDRDGLLHVYSTVSAPQGRRTVLYLDFSSESAIALREPHGRLEGRAAVLGGDAAQPRR